jgi:DNA repair exonuclease SbcCD ATPase subunit
MSKAQRREAAKERVREAADKVSRAMEMEKGLGPDISADRDAVAAECARLEAERAHLAKLHNASVKSGHGVCELCGGRLEDAAARAAQLAAELAAVMGASAQARSELAKMDAAVSKRRAAAAEVATLMSVGTEIGTDAMKSLDDLGEGPCVKDAEALLLAARLARSRWDAARSAIERRAQQNGMVARLASERAAADAAYQTAAEPFGGISPMDAPALIAAASKAAADAQCAQAQLEHCRRELILAKADATAAAKAALACRAKARDALSACRRVDQLAKVREWFHYANGPRFVSSRAMAMVSGGVNNFLESMGSAFSVIPDEAKLEFSAVFSDGRSDVPVSAQELSGGEKVALAVCFRLSAYCAFAGRLGVLSLDEPTVYLDDDNVSGFCRLMENLRVVAGKMSTQVLLATHEKSVAETADLIVQL